MRFRFGGYVLDTDRYELRNGPATVHVEPQVFKVLSYLIEHRERVVSKQELLAEIWGSSFVSESTLTSRIKAARRAVGDSGDAQRTIRTARGIGFRFVAPIVQVVADDADEIPAPGPAIAAARSSVPAARSRLIGRLDDLAATKSLLGRNRVVTISGPGGAGKTRLAIEIAQLQADSGREVVFAELAPAREVEDLVRIVAETAGIEGSGVEDRRTLAANLGSRPALIVMDNCEHLLDPAAELVDGILDAGPEAQVIITSREPLRVDGEAVLLLGSLGDAAAELFHDRASAVSAAERFRGDERVDALCQRLDGLPLAIELAAAQLRHLTLDELIDRLDDRLELLVGGRPRAGGRHSALGATIQWSYDLLPEAPRTVLDRLGVFPASFDLAAVQAVNPDLDRSTTIRTMADLVAKSLVVHVPESGRYRLLESIRLFAADRLASSHVYPETLELLRRHVVARATQRARAERWLSASLAAAHRDDIDSVRIAFQASIDSGRLGDALDLALSISVLWRNAVSYSEGFRWRAQLLRRASELTAHDRLWLEIVGADLGLGSGDPRLVIDCARSALDLAHSVEDPAAYVIATVFRSLNFADPRSVPRLEAARDAAVELGSPGLARTARGFLLVARLLAGDRSGLQTEISDFTQLTESLDYDRYICLWAAWTCALAETDGAAMRRCMDLQLANLAASDLRGNWLTMFCDALTMIAGGAEYAEQLGHARRRARLEGRAADSDCVLALAFAAALQPDYTEAAELLAAVEGDLFHDTANYVRYQIIRDLVVRPRMAGADFDAALGRGRRRRVDQILADWGI